MGETFKKIQMGIFYDVVSTLILLCAYFYLLVNYLISIKAGTISAVTLIFVVMESIVIFLLLYRRRPEERSSNIKEHMTAVTVTFLPLLFTPSAYAISSTAGDILIVIGGCLAIYSYLSLNRSFGITPALREIKTRGAYTYVRHPMYASYFFIYSGYLLLSTSNLNLILMTAIFIGLLLRIEYEETLLKNDPKYLEYCKEVKQKLIPFVY